MVHGARASTPLTFWSTDARLGEQDVSRALGYQRTIEWFECDGAQDLDEYGEYVSYGDHQYVSYTIPLTPPVMVSESQRFLTFDRDAVTSAA